MIHFNRQNELSTTLRWLRLPPCPKSKFNSQCCCFSSTEWWQCLSSSAYNADQRHFKPKQYLYWSFRWPSNSSSPSKPSSNRICYHHPASECHFEFARTRNIREASQARRRARQSISTIPSTRPQSSPIQITRQNLPDRIGTAPAATEIQDPTIRSNYCLSVATQQPLSLSTQPNEDFCHAARLQICCSTCNAYDARPCSHVGYHIWLGDGYFVDTPDQVLLFWPMNRAELEILPRPLLREILESEMGGVTVLGLPFTVNIEEMLEYKVRSLNIIARILGMNDQFVFRE